MKFPKLDSKNSVPTRFLRLLLQASLLVGFLLAFHLLTGLPIARSQGDNTYEAEVAKANDLMRRRRYEDALKSFKRANDMREKKSAEVRLAEVSKVLSSNRT